MFPEHIGPTMHSIDLMIMMLSKYPEQPKLSEKNMLKKDFKFWGSFEAGCEQNAVPNSLVDLIRMILEGPSLITLKVPLVH